VFGVKGTKPCELPEGLGEYCNRKIHKLVGVGFVPAGMRVIRHPSTPISVTFAEVVTSYVGQSVFRPEDPQLLRGERAFVAYLNHELLRDDVVPAGSVFPEFYDARYARPILVEGTKSAHRWW
jgi:hypothetical protein